MSVNGVILGMGLVLSIFQAARITVTRVDKDLYRIDDTRPARYLQTRYCHEYAYRDNAVVTVDKIHFSNGQSCDLR